MYLFAGEIRRHLRGAVALFTVLACASIAPASDLTVLHAFSGNDGEWPMGRLLFGQDGQLYGTTPGGGPHDSGVVFSLNPDGTEFQVARYLGDLSIGEVPVAGLVQTADGFLYGLASTGPTGGGGALFRMRTDGSASELLKAFSHEVDGTYPTRELLLGADGHLYGTAQFGGSANWGSFFAFDPMHTAFTVARSFKQEDFGPYNPQCALIELPDGRLCGTTAWGGQTGNGTVFSMAKDGSGFLVLHEFGPGEGRFPVSGLLLGSDGRLFGTTSSPGGSTNSIYVLNTDGTGFAVLHTFRSVSEGSEPRGLVEGSDGRLYGVCSRGGPLGGGGIFAINRDGTGFEVLHFMDWASEGAWPEGDLIIGSDGRLYGTNNAGGPSEHGSVFALSVSYDQPPRIGNPPAEQSRLGLPVVIYLGATRAPTSFTVEGLPTWLTFVEEDDLIIGTAEQLGEFKFLIRASNPNGSDTMEFTLLVEKRIASVQLGNLDQPYDGTPKTISVATYPEGLPVAVTYDGSATPPTELGTYSVVATVSDPSNEGTASGTLRILDPDTIAPYLKTEPSDEDVEVGGSVTFSVAAVGAKPFSYQWLKGFLQIPGATEASFTIPSAKTGDAGDYAVAVSNSLGGVISRFATLRVFEAPGISQQPLVKSAVLGSSVTYSIAVSGTGPFTYQWRRNGVAIAGATDSSLTLPNVEEWQGGNYSVVVSNVVGSVTSSAAALNIDTTPRLINVSCRGFAGVGDDTLVMGFYITGTTDKTLLIRGVGPKLADFNLPSVVADPRITVYRGNVALEGNDDWDPALAPEFARMGGFPLDPGSKDSAMTISLPPGGYTVHLVNSGPVAEGLIEVYDLSRDLGSRLTNVSCRLNMKPDQLIILGTALIGSEVAVLARNIGPGLAQYLPEGAVVLADPHLRVYSGDTEIAVNDDWEAATGAYFGPTGAFGLPAGSKDAAVRLPFTPGGVTVHASGNGGGGIAIIELYEST